MWETTNLQVAYDTPLEVIEKLRQKLKQYVAANSREWGGGCEINIDKMEYQNVIHLIIAMERECFCRFGLGGSGVLICFLVTFR